MSYKEKVSVPLSLAVDSCDNTFKLLPLVSGKKIPEDKPRNKKSKNKENKRQESYVNLDCLYNDFQEWFNTFLDDTLLTSSDLMNKHHLGLSNAFPDIIDLLETNVKLESKTERRIILNEKTPDELLSD